MAVLKFLAAILVALILGLLGGFVLREYHTTLGLVIGVVLILGAVATALPVPFHAGIQALADNWSTLKPAVTEAVGLRKRPDPDGDK